MSAGFNVRSLFVSQDQLNAEFAKEKQEYVDALNKQEIAEQEFESMKQQYKKLYDEVIVAKKDQEELNSLRKKEEMLLGRIFNDSYGSDKEWKLEMELDLLGQRKERVNAANIRWRGAHVYLDHAVKQLSWSTRRWAQIATHRVTILVVSLLFTCTCTYIVQSLYQGQSVWYNYYTCTMYHKYTINVCTLVQCTCIYTNFM